jgi:choline dehydrogenase-like flavoprotein
MPALTYMTNHSIDLYLTTEDLPHPDNRVVVGSDGRIIVHCGTAVMGTDPARSVLDPSCRAHDVDNLWVVDSDCFPSSAALNPALTIAANALRVAAVSDLTQ